MPGMRHPSRRRHISPEEPKESRRTLGRPRTMLRTTLVPCIAALVVAQNTLAQADCTLSASGDDDGPAFAAAVRSCDTTVVPAGTTLSVGSALNLTGLTNKHIVSDK